MIPSSYWRRSIKGYRVLYDPTAVTFEAGSASMADEYGRKSRIAAGRWQLSGKVLSLAPDHPGFVLKYVSHKLLRLLVMPLMILAFLSNLAVVMAQPAAGTGFEALIRLSPPWGQLFMAGQVSLYLLAALGAVLDHLGIRLQTGLFHLLFRCRSMCDIHRLVEIFIWQAVGDLAQGGPLNMAIRTLGLTQGKLQDPLAASGLNQNVFSALARQDEPGGGPGYFSAWLAQVVECCSPLVPGPRPLARAFRSERMVLFPVEPAGGHGVVPKERGISMWSCS